MMLNAKSVDHLPYRRHIDHKEQRAQNRAPRDSRGKLNGFGPLRTNSDVLPPVCDEGLYPSTDGIPPTAKSVLTSAPRTESTTASNAAEISSGSRTVYLPSPAARRISPTTSSSAVSVWNSATFSGKPKNWVCCTEKIAKIVATVYSISPQVTHQ